MQLVAYLIYHAINVYILFIFVYILGSWFPNFRGQSWYRLIAQLVEPYLEVFRGLPLRMGMVDLSPMIALLVLMIAQRLVAAAMVGGLRL